VCKQNFLYEYLHYIFCICLANFRAISAEVFLEQSVIDGGYWWKQQRPFKDTMMMMMMMIWLVTGDCLVDVVR